jgi:hypothetical protein
MSYAITHLTRILLYDPDVGGQRPKGEDSSAQQVTRRYSATIAIPEDRPSTWELAPGEDYRLLVLTEGFTVDQNNVFIDGRIKSNYQVQLDPSGARIGPNASHLRHWRLQLGENDAVEVLSEEVPGRMFREFLAITVEAIVAAPPASATVGITEDPADRDRRWGSWPSVLKSSLS